MTDQPEDNGVITALLERLVDRRLPRVLAIKEKVDSGEKLDATNIAYLERIFDDAKEVQRMLELHPQPKYEGLFAQVAQLYNDITTKALENERAGDSEQG